MRRAFAGVDLADLDPFVHMDQMGEVEYAPGEPKGTPGTRAPRLRDRHLHHRRGLRPPRQPRRRWLDHRRRHPVDDRRGRACRTSRPRPSGWWRAAVSSTASSSGSTCRATPSGARRPTRTSAARRWAWPPAPDAGALVRVIAGEVGMPRRVPARRTPRSRWRTPPWSRGARLDLPWEVDYNALVYVLSGEGTVGDAQAPGAHGQPRRAGCW